MTKQISISINSCLDCPFKQLYQDYIICNKEMRVLKTFKSRGFFSDIVFTKDVIGEIEIPDWCNLKGDFE